MKFSRLEIPDIILIEPCVYQDDRGYNKAPSLGASYRGMLKQIFSDMPNIKVICLGCPYDKLSMETSPSKVDLFDLVKFLAELNAASSKAFVILPLGSRMRFPTTSIIFLYVSVTF